MRSLLLLGLVACQTRGQAKVVTVSAASIALIGGAIENHEGYPPVSGIVAGSIAVISAIGILVLDDHPRSLSSHDWEPASHHSSSELLVAMHRSACFGTCPVYGVAIYRDGFVQFTGEWQVATIGDAAGHVAPERLRELERKLLASPVDDYVDRRVTDSSTVTLWVQPLGGRMHLFEHYLGDDSAPNAMFALEEAIDAAAGTEQWIGKR